MRFAISVILFFLVISCSKKNDQQVSLLGKWHDGNMYSYSPIWLDSNCHSDDFYDFQDNGKLVFDPGSLHCASNEIITNQTYYRNGDTLFINGNPWYITTLTANEFIYEGKLSYGTYYVNLKNRLIR